MASFPRRGRALALPPRRLQSPRGLTAFGVAPFAACRGGNARGLLLLSASIFRARRGFWQRRRPAHAALSSASLGEGLAALLGWQGCGFPGVSPPCRAMPCCVPVHRPMAPARQGWPLQAGQSSGAGLGRDPGTVTAVPCCPGQPSPVVFIFCCNRMLLGVSVGAERPWGAVWSWCGSVRGGSGVGAVKHLKPLRCECGLPRAPVSQCFLKEKRSREITHRRFQMSGLFFFL